VRHRLAVSVSRHFLLQAPQCPCCWLVWQRSTCSHVITASITAVHQFVLEAYVFYYVVEILVGGIKFRLAWKWPSNNFGLYAMANWPTGNREMCGFLPFCVNLGRTPQLLQQWSAVEFSDVVGSLLGNFYFVNLKFVKFQ